MFDLDFRQERELKFSLSNSYSLAFSRKTFEEGEFYIFNLFFSFFYNFTTVVSFTGHISASFFLYKFQKINVKIILQISFFYPTKSTLTFCISFSIILIINIHYHLY